jgi:cytochrome bd-type quinol oxidase subunit 1
VRVIPWIYAAGAILSALWLTSSLAFAVAPKGRSQLMQDITSTHVAASEASLVLALRIAFSVGIPAVLLVGHGLAYYGLRARARWGWLSAVIIAGLWSIVLAGIPVLVRLLRREIREAYGVV